MEANGNGAAQASSAPRRSLWGGVDPIALNAVLKGMSGLVGNDAPFPTQWPRTSLNQTFDPRRSVDLSAGYPQSESGQGFGSINPDFYRNLYERECIATRVVQVLPNECWQVTPLVFETEDAERETPFEQAFDLLPQMLRGTQSWYKDTANNLFWEPCKRVDRLSGIGTFGILLLGIDDSRNLDQPADGVSTLDPTGKANPWGAGELSAGAQWGPGGAYASGEGSWPGAPDTVGDPSQGGPAPGGGFTHAASRGPKTPTNLRGTQNAALEWYVANSRRNGAKWFDVRRPSLAVNAGLTDALAKVGKKLAGMSDPGPMGGYGQVFLNKDGSSAWYVGGDGDDDGWSAVVKRELKKAGVSSVKCEAESFPPRDGSWVQCHPKKRAWVNPLANHFAASCPVNAAHHDEVPVTNVDPNTGMPGPRTWKPASDATMTSAGLAMVLKTNGAVTGVPSQGEKPSGGGPAILDQLGRPIRNDAGSYQDAGNTIQLGASAIGTDAQYVGIQLSPPEFPQTEPSKEDRQLLFLRAFDESLVQIVQYEANVRNPRFGLPVMYRITLNDPREQHSGIGLPMATVRVHWSRIIHVADNRGSSEVFGVPRMRPVLNRLLDLRKLYAAGAEGYWQMAFTKLQFVTHPQLGSDVDVDAGAMMDQVEKLINDLQGYLLSRGGEWKAIAPTIIEYTNFILAQVEAICIQLGVPKRVFMGTERGELASSQDDSKWNDVLKERQDNYLTPLLIVPFIDRLIAMGVLPEPEGYSVQWPDLDSQTDKDKAQIALQRAQALGMFISQGCEAAMTLKRFFMLNYGIDDEEAEQWVEEAKESQDENMTIPSEGEQGHPATEEQSDFGGFDEDGNPIQQGDGGGDPGDEDGGPAGDDGGAGAEDADEGGEEDDEATENIALIAADAWADEAVDVDNEWKEELHPRDKGKFASAEGAPATSTKDTPFHTDDVNVAAKLLGEGRKVVLSQPRQVSTLLDRLAKIVKEAEAKGEAAPHYDLCNVSVAGTNLFCSQSMGIARIKMPQLRGTPTPGSEADRNAALYGGKDAHGKVTLQKSFVAELRRTVNVEDAMEDAAHLRASQNELDGAKAARMLKHARKEEEQEPIVVSRDNYIVDGHHHWAGLVAHEFEKGMKGLKVPVRRVDMGIVELLDRANKFAARMGMRSESVTGNEQVDNLWSDAAREAAREARRAHAKPHDEHHGHDPLEHATHQVHVAHELHEVGEAFGGGEAHHLVQEAHEAGQHALEHGVEHHVSPADAGAIVARHLYPHAVKAVESILQKGGPKAQRVAEGIHAFHEGASRISEKAVSGLQARYGKATANLILASGNLTAHTLLAPLGAAGHALPGQKFIGSIPALALAEAGKRLGLVGEGSALERSVAHVGTWVHAVKNAIGKGVSAVTKHVAGQALDIAARNQATTNEVQLSPEEIDEAAEEFAAQLREEFEALAKKHADKLGTMDEE